MKTSAPFLFAAILSLPSMQAQAQTEPTAPSAQRIGRIAPPSNVDMIPLPVSVGRSSTAEVWMQGPDSRLSVRNVTRPTLEPFLPQPGKANGTAVVVAPGGAFIALAYDLEGRSVARALADRGFTAFVLKYRIVPSPASDAEFGAFAMETIRRAGAEPDKILGIQYPPALEDARNALAYIRANATRYGIDAARVGMIGFSAGAISALHSVIKSPAAAPPAFVGYIYGPQVPVTVPADAPPLFTAFAFDDPLFKTRGFPIVEAWQQAGRPVELHVYAKGGHGFGTGLQGTTSTLIIDQFAAWLAMQGFAPPAKGG